MYYNLHIILRRENFGWVYWRCQCLWLKWCLTMCTCKWVTTTVVASRTRMVKGIGNLELGVKCHLCTELFTFTYYSQYLLTTLLLTFIQLNSDNLPLVVKWMQPNPCTHRLGQEISYWSLTFLITLSSVLQLFVW